MQRLPHIACVLIYAIVGRHISSVDCNVGLKIEDIESSEGNENVNETALKLLKSDIKALQAIYLAVHANKGEELLFLSVQKDLLHVNTSNFKREKVVMLDDSFIVGTDYDAGDGYLYWRTHDGRLERAKRNGTGRETILSDIGAGGIAIDWVARNIYWTNEDNGTISVSSLDGKYTKTLIPGLSGPRMLAVDPGAGRLYWSEWKSKPKIARSSLDGSNIENFVDDDIVWPNGIALDYEKRLVYFADAQLDRIEVIGMDGSGRKIFLNESTPHVFGLSFLGGYLYWTDWRSESAERVKVDDVSNREVIMISSKRMMAITAKYANPMFTSNPCGTGNVSSQQCSHFCFYTGQDAVCGCPDNPQEGANDSCVE